MQSIHRKLTFFSFCYLTLRCTRRLFLLSRPLGLLVFHKSRYQDKKQQTQSNHNCFAPHPDPNNRPTVPGRYFSLHFLLRQQQHICSILRESNIIHKKIRNYYFHSLCNLVLESSFIRAYDGKHVLVKHPLSTRSALPLQNRTHERFRRDDTGLSGKRQFGWPDGVLLKQYFPTGFSR